MKAPSQANGREAAEWMERLRQVAQWRVAGLSYGRIAAQIGVSRARAHQLCVKAIQRGMMAAPSVGDEPSRD